MKQYTIAANTTGIEEQLREHQMRVSKICEKIARALKMHYDSMMELLIAAQLHDIGKLWIPEQILNKPGFLTEEEREIMKKHVWYGYNYAKERKMNERIAEAILYHHEHYNGAGYFGLQGKGIPFYARIIALADAFDTMTTSRPYRKAVSISEAVEEIKRNSGTQFDPEITAIFIELSKDGLFEELAAK